MKIVPLLIKEFDMEAATTRKMLERIPDDKYDWKPHEKSMDIRQLSKHVAEIPGWISMAFSTSELDFAATPYQPSTLNSTAEVLALFEKSVAEGRGALEEATEDDLLPSWTLRNGNQILQVFSKYEVVRHALAQEIHHRAQLGVFLRLLNIPIPGSYGPSADEMSF